MTTGENDNMVERPSKGRHTRQSTEQVDADIRGALME
jgi:hypothetical protein